MPKAKMSEDYISNLREKALKGSAEAQNMMGVLYATGDIDGRCNNSEAIDWYLRAASLGFSEAMWNAGSMLVDGDVGVDINEVVGLILIRGAADAFQTSACLFLSRCYECGYYGFPKNENLSGFWRDAAYRSDLHNLYNKTVEMKVLRFYFPDLDI